MALAPYLVVYQVRIVGCKREDAPGRAVAAGEGRQARLEHRLVDDGVAEREAIAASLRERLPPWQELCRAFLRAAAR